MSDIVIKFEGGDVIIRGPKDILKIVIDPVVGGIQTITEPVKSDISKKRMVKKPKIKPAKIVSKPKDKKTALGRGNRVTQQIIDQIAYLRDEEKMTSKQIAEEVGISLATVNRYYRPLSSEKSIS